MSRVRGGGGGPGGRVRGRAGGQVPPPGRPVGGKARAAAAGLGLELGPRLRESWRGAERKAGGNTGKGVLVFSSLSFKISFR